MRQKAQALSRDEIERIASDLGVKPAAVAKWFAPDRKVPRAWLKAIELEAERRANGKHQ